MGEFNRNDVELALDATEIAAAELDVGQMEVACRREDAGLGEIDRHHMGRSAHTDHRRQVALAAADHEDPFAGPIRLVEDGEGLGHGGREPERAVLVHAVIKGDEALVVGLLRLCFPSCRLPRVFR